MAEEIYLREVNPRAFADVIADNTEIDTLRIIEQRHPAPPHHSGG